jgi:hypothetical protein
MVGYFFKISIDMTSIFITDHGHGHGHGHSHTAVIPPTDGVTEPDSAMAMESTGAMRRSFSVAAEEYSLGDIVRLILSGLSR